MAEVVDGAGREAQLGDARGVSDQERGEIAPHVDRDRGHRARQRRPRRVLAGGQRAPADVAVAAVERERVRVRLDPDHQRDELLAEDVRELLAQLLGVRPRRVGVVAPPGAALVGIARAVVIREQDRGARAVRHRVVDPRAHAPQEARPEDLEASADRAKRLHDPDRRLVITGRTTRPSMHFTQARNVRCVAQYRCRAPSAATYAALCASLTERMRR